MPDLTAPLFVASGFVGIGWLIIRADREYADAIRHTLSIFALVLALLVTPGVMAKLLRQWVLGGCRIGSRPDPSLAFKSRVVR